MSTIVRSIHISLLTPLIVIVMIGALTGCSGPPNSSQTPETGPSNSISKGSEAVIRTSLKTDARSLKISLEEFRAEDGKYPPLEKSGELVELLDITLNQGNYLLSYSPTADGQFYQITLANELLSEDKIFTFDNTNRAFN